jgi:CxxC motif-containing protein (DUF1111 family)
MPPRRPPFAHTALTATALASVLLATPLQASPDAASPDELTGGATTVWADGKNAFSFPAANLSDEERTRFVIGNSFFKRNWVQAPASTKVRDGTRAALYCALVRRLPCARRSWRAARA